MINGKQRASKRSYRISCCCCSNVHLLFLLKKYSADFSYSNQGKIKIVAQQRAALKTQLLLIEADNRTSLLAISGDNVVPVWTASDSKEERADVSQQR